MMIIIIIVIIIIIIIIIIIVVVVLLLQTFKINQVYNLEPTFAHCLNISIEFVKTYFHVSVKYITGKNLGGGVEFYSLVD